jgi:coniferyl-aldehyde dehydrogenase
MRSGSPTFARWGVFYHGREGFDAFSKLRPVFQQGRISSVQMLFQPPYSGVARRVVNFMIRMKS